MTDTEEFRISSKILAELEDWCGSQGLDVWEQAITIGSDGDYSELLITGTREQLTMLKLRYA
jgi:hypothetical protein